jgi:AcrR family transcriptional regulator
VTNQPVRLNSSTQPTVARAIDVAARLFAERGYDATATRDISRALGITNGTFYHYFPSKEMLLVQICRESILRMIDAVSGAIAGLTISREKISTLIAAHTVAAVENRALRITMLTERRSLGPENAAEINSLAAQYRHIVQDVIIEAQHAGIARKDLPAEALSLALLNLMNYSIIRSNNERSPDLESADDAAQYAEILTTIFLDGAAPR